MEEDLVDEPFLGLCDELDAEAEDGTDVDENGTVAVGVNGREVCLQTDISVKGINSGAIHTGATDGVNDADLGSTGAVKGAEPGAVVRESDGRSETLDTGAEASDVEMDGPFVRLNYPFWTPPEPALQTFDGGKTEEQPSPCDEDIGTGSTTTPEMVATSTSGPHLPIVYDGKVSLMTLLDTGSNRNIISENVLNSNGISVSISPSTI